MCVYCENCGSRIEDEDRFCPVCGNEIRNIKTTKSKRSRKVLVIVFGIGLLSVLTLGICFIYGKYNLSDKQPNKGSGGDETICVFPEQEGGALEEPDYIFPDSNSKYLTEEDVAGMSLREINYAKNEIFARHGRKFDSEELSNYFSEKSWYEGVYSPDEFDEYYGEQLLNKYEKYNAEFLREIEFSLNANGYLLDQ